MPTYASTAAAVYGILAADSSLQTLLGAAGRIHREHPPVEISLTSALPGYLILSRESETTVAGTGYGSDELWQIRVIAIDTDTRDAIASRVRSLLNQPLDYNAISFTGGTRQHLDIRFFNAGAPGFDPAASAYAVNLRYRVLSVETAF